jgi:hypothetical protein
MAALCRSRIAGPPKAEYDNAHSNETHARKQGVTLRSMTGLWPQGMFGAAG